MLSHSVSWQTRFGVEGLGFGVVGFRFGVEGLGFGVSGLTPHLIASQVALVERFAGGGDAWSRIGMRGCDGGACLGVMEGRAHHLCQPRIGHIIRVCPQEALKEPFTGRKYMRAHLPCQPRVGRVMARVVYGWV